MVVAGAFMVSVSYKDEVVPATLLVPAVRVLLEVVPVFDLVPFKFKSIYSPKTQQKDDVQVSDSERHRSHQSQLHFEH